MYDGSAAVVAPLKDKVLVRSESYNKNGKLLAYSELSSMK